MTSINCRGQLIDFKIPKIMGVINLNQNSFYHTSTALTIEEVFIKIEKMVNLGVDIIDIGGQSTSPFVKPITTQEELEIVMPTIKKILKQYPHQIFSIDTFYPEIAEACASEGVQMINDISGGSEKMFKVISSFQIPYICTHKQGSVFTMHQQVNYDNLIKDILIYFDKKIKQMNQFKIKDIILDIGIGFSKTIEQNFELIQHLNLFKYLSKPLLIGVSRKSFIYKTLGVEPENALNGTTAMNMMVLNNGANIIRVHDVLEAKECVTLFQKTNQFKNDL